MENKQKFISQIMTSKSPMRSCEDVDETVLSYAEIKALCAGNPLIAEKMNLDVEVAKLRMIKAEHQSQHYRLEDDLLKRYPEQITAVKERIEGIGKDIEKYAGQNAKSVQVQTGIDGEASATAHFPGMTINGVEHKEKETAAKALLEACKGVKGVGDNLPVGEYMGFKTSLQCTGFSNLFGSGKTFTINLLLRGAMTYQTDLGTDAFGNITRINNVLSDLPKKLEGAKAQLETLLSQQEAAKQELQNPFALADELAEKEARLALLNADLNIDGNGGFDVTNDDEERESDSFVEGAGDALDELGVKYTRDYPPGLESRGRDEYQAASAKSARPPILETIRSYSTEKQTPFPGRKPTERDI